MFLICQPTEDSTHVTSCCTVVPQSCQRSVGQPTNIIILDVTKTKHWKHICKCALCQHMQKKEPRPTSPTPDLLLQVEERPPAPMHRWCAMHGVLHHRHELRPILRSFTAVCPRSNCMIRAGFCSLVVHTSVRRCDQGIACSGRFHGSSIPARTQSSMLCECHSWIRTIVICNRTPSTARNHQTCSHQTIADNDHCLQMLAINTQCLLQASTHRHAASCPQVLTH